MALFKGREMVFKAFDSGIFSNLKESEPSSDVNDTYSTDNTLLTPIEKGTGLKILTPKQILQRLPIAVAQVKAGK